MATQLRTHTAGEAVRRPEIDPGVPRVQADTPYTERARYFDSSNAFALKYPPVPCHQFLAERDRALDPASPTGLIPLDLSERARARLPGDHALDHRPATPGSARASASPRASRRAASSTT